MLLEIGKHRIEAHIVQTNAQAALAVGLCLDEFHAVAARVEPEPDLLERIGYGTAGLFVIQAAKGEAARGIKRLGQQNLGVLGGIIAQLRQGEQRVARGVFSVGGASNVIRKTGV